ncbi:MAG: TolC family protein, partial [Prolixibacteraceae bacterium]|nr:TolC family protein [Prolixibacteraceae bacterium]
YDFENNVEIYREQKTLSAYSELSLTQNILATGGEVFLSSDIYRLQNYNEQNLNSWSTTPIRIGFNQPLFGFNRFKWEKKISPLKFEKAKQNYILSVQQTNLKTVTLYFNLILAKVHHSIASSNVIAADTLFKTGSLRFEIASIQHEELLDLELSKFNSQIERAQAEKDLEKARFNLVSFLGINGGNEIEPVIPNILNNLQIDIESAFEYAQRLNPEILNLKQKGLEAGMALDETEKNARFNANIRMSYGFNQTSASLDKAYQNPLDQQMVSMNVSIPVLDWGDRKGQKQMARKQKEVVDIEVKQALLDFEQKVKLKVIDFNLQANVVTSSARADTLAQQSYELTKKHFLLGKADVLRLTSAMKARQQAREKYISSLATYWQYFYEVQEYTLYDFVANKALKKDFEVLIEK